MSLIFKIAKQEWCYWRRSRLVLISLSLTGVLILLSSWLTASQMEQAHQARSTYQAEAEETFKAQPDRQPHRMVHYGHYAFRTPSALSVFDPGVDSVTGQSIFLEGHHQNTAMFADQRGNMAIGGFGALTVAKVYQWLVPLLLIVMGHSLFAREREQQTLQTLLAQGVTGTQLVAGKGLALGSVALLMTAPALVINLWAIFQGSTWLASVALYFNYLLFLVVWVGVILAVTVASKKRSLALGVLLALWMLFSLIIPKLGVAVTSAVLPSEGKFQTDLKMAYDIRALGNGHNASDPAFAKLKADTLAKHQVESIEELPFNYRGLIATISEQQLTDVMNQYAKARMEREMQQSQALEFLSILSPLVAIDYSSRHLAGTDLATHHRFLRESEDLRLDFVQSLNKAHTHQLSYHHDVNRNKTQATFDAARVSSSNWQALDTFRFQPDTFVSRLSRASLPLIALAAWSVLLLTSAFYQAKRLTV